MIARKRFLPAFVTLLMVFAMMPMIAGTVSAEDTQTEVSSIYVGITRPAAGQAFADAVSNVRISGDGFTVARVEWCEDYKYDDNNKLVAIQDSDHLGEHGIFNPKFQYRLIVELEASDGYVFPYQSISNTNLLSSSILHTYVGGITGTRDLSDDQKSAQFVLTGISAYTTVNVSRPKTGEEVAPSVSLPEFEAAWYSVESAQWCDAAGENASQTRTFAEGETGYILAHLASNASTYNWYSKPNIRISGGEYIKTLDQTTYDKLDVVMSVKAAAPATSLGDITIDLTNDGTTLSGNELEAVNGSITELGKRGAVGIPDYQAYDLDNNGTMDVYMDNMWNDEGAASRFYQANECSIESGYTLTIPDEIKEILLAAGNAHCDKIIFITDIEPEVTEAIQTVDIGNIWTKLDPVNKIPFTAEVHDELDSDGINFNSKMEVYDEAWGSDVVINKNDGSGTPKVGKSYEYSVVLKAKKGWTFSDDFKFIYGGNEITEYNKEISTDRKGLVLSGFISPVTVGAVNLSAASVTGIANKTYTGKAQTQKPTVKMNVNGTAFTLKNGTDFTVSYKNNTKAGTATVTITGKGNYKGAVSKTFKINKAANPLKIGAKTASVKYSKVKKKTQTLAVTKVIKFTKKGVGTMNYTKTSGNKKISINKKTGKVNVKKGLKKGTYKVKVRVKALGNANYKASGVKTVTFTVKVR